MSGYRVILSKPIGEGLLCPHCRLVLKDAVQTEEGYRLCEGCLNEISGMPDGKCSECGIVIGRNEKHRLDKAVQRAVQQISVKCNYVEYGCSWESELKYLEHHLESCIYKPVRCPNVGCEELLSQDQLDNHLTHECTFRNILCQYCEQKMPFIQSEDHYSSCSKMPLVCDKCKTQVYREELNLHEAFNCTEIQCQVPGCSKLLQKLGAGESGLESTSDHLADTEAVFQHIQKLGVYLKSNLKKLTEVELQCKALQTQATGLTAGELVKIQRDVMRDLKILGDRMSSVETIVEKFTRSSDKNSNSKATEMQLTVVQQNDRILKLENMVKTLQNQSENQSKIIAQLQQQQQYGGGGMSQRTGDTRSQVIDLEKRVSSLQVHLSELELQLQASLASTHNGSFLWRIPDVARRRREAIEGKITSIYSPPFYTGRNGYKMCVRAYLNGDGMGRTSHLSLFFVIMRGEYDPLLKWPFDYKVSLILVDQTHRKHIVNTFKPTPESSSFKMPETEMNIASGCPTFCKLSFLDDTSYVDKDVLFIKCIVDTSRIFHP